MVTKEKGNNIHVWGISSVGRASDLHSEGQGFEFPILHKLEITISRG